MLNIFLKFILSSKPQIFIKSSPNKTDIHIKFNFFKNNKPNIKKYYTKYNIVSKNKT